MTHLVVSEETLFKSEGTAMYTGRKDGVPRFRNIAVLSPRCMELELFPDMCL